MQAEIIFRLSELRKSRGYSVERVAKELDVPPAYLEVIENHPVRVSFDFVERYAEAVQADIKFDIIPRKSNIRYDKRFGHWIVQTRKDINGRYITSDKQKET